MHKATEYFIVLLGPIYCHRICYVRQLWARTPLRSSLNSIFACPFYEFLGKNIDGNNFGSYKVAQNFLPTFYRNQHKKWFMTLLIFHFYILVFNEDCKFSQLTSTATCFGRYELSHIFWKHSMRKNLLTLTFTREFVPTSFRYNNHFF